MIFLAEALDEATQEFIKGLFSEEMAEITKNAPTDNYIMYIFLVITIALFALVLLVVRNSAKSIAQAQKCATEPYEAQLQVINQIFTDYNKELNKINAYINEFTEELQDLKTRSLGESDVHTMLMQKFIELQQTNQRTFSDLFAAWREYERSLNMKVDNLNRELNKITSMLEELTRGS